MKEVAKTITKLSSSDIYQRILDPADEVTDVADLLIQHFSYDLYSRRPGPALLDDGVLKPTDLDLACFLSALIDREAVINLPTYRARRPATVKPGEHIVSKENRHGRVVGLSSNKEVFSFSVRIFDANVITTIEVDDKATQSVGAYRNFMLVDIDGSWWEGWRKIEFVPSAKENHFLTDKKLWTGNTVYFDNFVHPNRWVSFYGSWYVLTKILVKRLRNEIKFRNAEVKDKLAQGITFPETPAKDASVSSEWTPSQSVQVAAGKKVEVKAFEADIDLDGGKEVPTEFPRYPDTVEGLVMAKVRSASLLYQIVPLLSFITRATELAFYQRIKELPAENMADFDFPFWIKGAHWEPNYQIKRTMWNRLVLHQSFPFSKGLALRFRTYTKTERVSVNS